MRNPSADGELYENRRYTVIQHGLCNTDLGWGVWWWRLVWDSAYANLLTGVVHEDLLSDLRERPVEGGNRRELVPRRVSAGLRRLRQKTKRFCKLFSGEGLVLDGDSWSSWPLSGDSEDRDYSRPNKCQRFDRMAAKFNVFNQCT